MSKKEKKKVVVIEGEMLIDGTGAKPRKNSVVVIEEGKIGVDRL